MTAAPAQIRLLMELRREGVTDTKVLSAIERTPRELFVPDNFRDRAYDNSALPIGRGQTISQPLVVALMTQALEVGPRMRVLEIGTGSGYQSAVLAALCRRVYTVERHKTLLAEAEARLRKLNIHNVTAMAGDGSVGWPGQAPFERIIVTAAAEGIPPTLTDQLGEGGVMVIPVGPAPDDQWLIRLRRKDGKLAREDLFPVRFVPLVAAGPVE